MHQSIGLYDPFQYHQEPLRHDASVRMDCDEYSGSLMFRDLRARTKFLILCGVCLLRTSVATYALLVEKQIAMNFARRELVGSKYLALLRPIYVAVLKTQAKGDVGHPQNVFGPEPLDLLSRADAKLLALYI